MRREIMHDISFVDMLQGISTKDKIAAFYS
jgi:hypothetical protein